LLGLKNAFESEVYHCDVSVGNILINSHPTFGNIGALIDFDHASTYPHHHPKDPITVCVSKDAPLLN
jgi:predicted unusual protein kinase regulating ubiquinone biosynthesis (AarF/ABC1/UbiB family)